MHTMPMMLNSILIEAGLNVADVRLLRHKDQRAARGRTPYELWRDNRPQFDLYQAMHGIDKRAKLNGRYWASFLGTPTEETLFIGLYAVGGRRLLEQDVPHPHMDGAAKAGSCDLYDVMLEQALGDLIGKLLIEWGPGERAWVQRAAGETSQSPNCV